MTTTIRALDFKSQLKKDLSLLRKGRKKNDKKEKVYPKKRDRPNKPVMDVEKYYSNPWENEDTSGPPPF